MKKIITVVLLLFFLIPVSNVFAAEPVDELAGKTLNLAAHTYSTGDQIKVLTDGDLTTGLKLPVSSEKKVLWLSVDPTKQFTALQIFADAGVTFDFIDPNGNAFYSVSPAQTLASASKPFIFPAFKTNVAKIRIEFNNSSLIDVKEIKLFTGDLNQLPKPVVNGLTETHTDTSATLRWNNPVQDDFDGVSIKKDGIEIVKLPNTTTSYTVGSLNPETTYSFEVLASYKDGTFSKAQVVTVETSPVPVDATPPSNISNLLVTNTDTIISFLYSLPIDTDFKSLKIYRDGELIQSGHTATSFDDFGLIGNKTYVYKFVSVDLAGNESSGFVQTVTTDKTVDNVAPPAVSGIVPTNGSGSGSLVWDKSISEDIKGYNVYVNGVKHNTALILANTYTLTNLLNGQDYLITVTAVDTSDNESVPSENALLQPVMGLMPIFKTEYDLKDVSQGTAEWFASMWPILAFAVGIPLAFMVARRVKALFIA